MTICIAAICKWLYPKTSTSDPYVGSIVVTASDRMMTAGDIEYEPPQIKSCTFRKNTVILVAGEVSAHSEALESLGRIFDGIESPDGLHLAEAYGEAISKYRRRRAASKYLNPLGLTEDSFINNQAAMNPNIASDLHYQMQNHTLDAEAIVVNVSGKLARIFHIDRHGFVTNHSDTGFVSIGIGAPHANSQLMQLGYTNNSIFFPAVAAVYLAKKRAQVAPGVGRATDMYFVTNLGWEMITSPLSDELEKLYNQYDKQNRKSQMNIVKKLDQFAHRSRSFNSTTQAGA